MTPLPPLLLASGSPYRRALLERLELPFSWASPAVDETPLPGETPAELAGRLARAKALALSDRYADHLIIGSDQAAALDGRMLSKPGTFEAAQAQLRAASGRMVTFYTGLCLYDPRGDRASTAVEPFTVHFRQLQPDEIDRYLQREQPFDCAGSFKAEGLGITLFERLSGDDPNALTGLPLIRLVSLLRKAGWQIP